MKRYILAMIVLTAAPCLAELPGLPAAAPQAVQPSASEVRPGDHAAPVVTQTGPVRGSLFKQGAVASTSGGSAGDGGAPFNRTPVSFISVQPPEPKRYKKNDIVTIIIREDSNAKVDGKGNAKKTQDFDLALQQWIQMGLSASGLPTLSSSTNTSTLPEIKFKYSNDRQADAQQERQDTFSARISATVVDVKPNGTMVIEATKQIFLDKEEQIFTLAGLCRVEDIGADNSILSTQLANLQLSKQTKGEVRDNIKRGWLNKFLDVVSPF